MTKAAKPWRRRLKNLLARNDFLRVEAERSEGVRGCNIALSYEKYFNM